MSFPSENRDERLSCEEVLRILAEGRRADQLVISNQMTARIWPHFSQHPLDFHYLSSTMGGAVPFGLGLALSQPELEVVVLSGDGSLLMNLGCLVTVTACRARNLTIVLFDNGRYEVTGGQLTPGEQAEVDYGELARGCRFPTVHACRRLADWEQIVKRREREPGPRFVWLRVKPVDAATPRATSIRVQEALQQLQANLRTRPREVAPGQAPG